MIHVSRHVVDQFRRRLRRLPSAACVELVTAAVRHPLATRTLDGGRVRRYGALVEGLAFVVTVDEVRRVAVTVRPARCGSDGAVRGRRYRAARFVWERSTWSRAS